MQYQCEQEACEVKKHRIESAHLLGRHQVHLGMCIPGQTGLRLEVSFLCACRSPSQDPPKCLLKASPRTPSGFPRCPLRSRNQYRQSLKETAGVGRLECSPERGVCHEPRMSKFFSGKRFPLATLSSNDDQIFFFEPSLLVGRLLVPDALVPRFGLDDIVRSRATMPQRACTIAPRLSIEV